MVGVVLRLNVRSCLGSPPSSWHFGCTCTMFGFPRGVFLLITKNGKTHRLDIPRAADKRLNVRQAKQTQRRLKTGMTFQFYELSCRLPHLTLLHFFSFFFWMIQALYCFGAGTKRVMSHFHQQGHAQTPSISRVPLNPTARVREEFTAIAPEASVSTPRNTAVYETRLIAVSQSKVI